MKNLKQIIGLYQGCNVQCRSVAGVITERKIKSVHSYGGVELSECPSGSMGNRAHVRNFGRTLFPLLRPLSSMTEDEARGLVKMIVASGDEGAVFSEMNKGNGWLVISDDAGFNLHISDWGNIMVDHVFGLYDCWADATLIPHLCALGFDCFNLIGLKIAKDVTKK